MTRKILVLVILASAWLSSAAFCAQSFFAPYPSSFNVDLTDIETYCGVPDDLSFTSGFAPGYSDKTLIALIGFSDLGSGDHTVTLKFEVLSGDTSTWEYVSASEPYLSRPMRLDIIATARQNGSVTAHNKVGSIGYEGTTTNNTVTFKFTGDEIWFDVVLVLPDVTSSNTLAKDDYYIQMQITGTLDENNEQKWPFYINGYVSDKTDTNASYVMMHVVPHPRASAISLSRLADEEKTMEIADYFYESMAFMPNDQSNIYNEKDSNGNDLRYSNQINNNYYIYASSSANDTDQDFLMYYAGLDPSQPIASNYCFNYKITLKGQKGEKTFKGATPVSTNDMLQAKKEIGHAGPNHENSSDDDGVVYFYDSGTVLISAVEPTDLNDLKGGVYTSQIYFHVVSDY